MYRTIGGQQGRVVRIGVVTQISRYTKTKIQGVVIGAI